MADTKNRPVTADELERRATAAMKALIQLDYHKDQVKPGRLVREGTRAYVESDVRTSSIDDLK